MPYRLQQKPCNSVADPYVSLLARLQRRVGVCSRLPMPQHKESAIAAVVDVVARVIDPRSYHFVIGLCTAKAAESAA